MSAIHIDKLLVHYEMIGGGRPIIFLHSWLGSWRSWMPIMEAVSDRYRGIAVDFWGFGDSAPQRDVVAVKRYVDQLKGFVDGLGIVTPHLVGHGLGGVVALRAVSDAPDRFGKVLITGTPILGSQVKQIANPGGIGRLFSRGGNNDAWLKLVRQAGQTGNNTAGFSEIIEDIEATDPAVVNQTMAALAEIDLRPDLARLTKPLLAICGGRDTIVTYTKGAEIEERLQHFRQVLIFDKSGHFPFLDQTNQFTRALLQFLSEAGQVVELKEEWRRRVSQREYL